MGTEEVVLLIIVGWCVLSVIVGLLAGRFLRGIEAPEPTQADVFAEVRREIDEARLRAHLAASNARARRQAAGLPPIKNAAATRKRPAA